VLEFDAEAPQATASEGLTQGPKWQLERDSNLQSFGRKATNLSMGHWPTMPHESMHVCMYLCTGLRRTEVTGS